MKTNPIQCLLLILFVIAFSNTNLIAQACGGGIDEDFSDCVLPSGWSVSSTVGAAVDNGFFFNQLDAPGGVGPSNFDGCVALMDDDFANNLGVACILTPVVDLTTYSSPDLIFDWQHEALAGGGNFLVDVWDGANWVNVFFADDDSDGNDETVGLDIYANTDFQVRFCYDDEGGFQWGAAVDNVVVTGATENSVPTCDADGGRF